MLNVVIMAGGSGTRFWPASRASMPKQMLKIVSEKTMMEETADNLRKLAADEKIYIATGHDLYKHIKKVLPNVNYVLEHYARNTAAAIGLAAIHIAKDYPDGVMFIETADHFYKDVGKYHKHIQAAVDMAEKDKIVLIGIKPTHPHTGFGYIQKEEEIEENAGVKIFGVKEFKEKPDFNTATDYVDSGEYLWNSGMFIAKCSIMLREIELMMPSLHKGLEKIKESGFDDAVAEKVFKKLESVSIDYGVMEKSSNVAVVEGEMHWDDIGDWAAMERVHNADKDGNIIKVDWDGNAKNCIIFGEGRKIHTERVSDLIIVDTPDCLLVCSKEDAQEVGELVNLMKENKEWKKYTEDLVKNPKKNHIQIETYGCNIKNNAVVATINVKDLDIEQSDDSVTIKSMDVGV